MPTMRAAVFRGVDALRVEEVGCAVARQTAETVADELARLGYSAPQILRSFNDPSFGAAYAAFGALGESVVRTIIVRAVIRWPHVRGPVSSVLSASRVSTT